MVDLGDGRSPGSGANTPRWVKVSAIIGGVLVLLIAIALFTGHGPGRHIAGGRAPFSGVMEDGPGGHVPSEDGK